MPPFSERSSKFRVSVKDQIRDLWSKLPWPSPGAGEPDDPSRGLSVFRSYGTRVQNVSPDPDGLLTRRELDLERPSATVNIPFALVSALGLRRTAVSQILLGPGIVESIDFECSPVTGDSNITFSVFVSETPEATTTIAPRPSGQDIFGVQALGPGVAAPDDTSGFLITGQNAPRLILSHPVGLHIPIDRFFLKPSVCQTAGPLISITGFISYRRLHRGLTLPGSRAYRE